MRNHNTRMIAADYGITCPMSDLCLQIRDLGTVLDSDSIGDSTSLLVPSFASSFLLYYRFLEISILFLLSPFNNFNFFLA
jgi:hypothetical protein